MSSQSSPSMRKQSDFTKLIMAGYELKLREGSTQDFHVNFHGPKETIYENGIWKVHVILPDDYPFSSPSIGFVNKILHPNIDEASGSVCLDVINQTWTPLYSLVNIFEIFLPQLLTYPNPTDPLNSEAASLYLRDRTKYNERVREYVRLHADSYRLQAEAAKPPGRANSSIDSCPLERGSSIRRGMNSAASASCRNDPEMASGNGAVVTPDDILDSVRASKLNTSEKSWAVAHCNDYGGGDINMIYLEEANDAELDEFDDLLNDEDDEDDLLDDDDDFMTRPPYLPPGRPPNATSDLRQAI